MIKSIDFVVTWVDSNDIEWQKSKTKALNMIDGTNEKFDYEKNRYRDIECFKYWFRCVEKNAPWVRKIFVVTNGQKPVWLNTDNEKIVLIKHSDYISQEYLPTFNSNAIESQIHLIPDLSEQFVYFNDDMFLINKVNPSDFFRNGLPCDSMSFHPIEPIAEDKRFYLKVCNDLEIINSNFDFTNFKKNNLSKIFSHKQGKHVIMTVLLSRLNSFRGFYNYHVPVPYLKKTFDEVWNIAGDRLRKTMSFRFRNNSESINHWVFQYWQFATGHFYQRKSNFSKYITMDDERVPKIILSKKYKAICINDVCLDERFESSKKKIIDAFEKKYPNKSKFEK